MLATGADTPVGGYALLMSLRSAPTFGDFCSAESRHTFYQANRGMTSETKSSRVSASFRRSLWISNPMPAS